MPAYADAPLSRRHPCRKKLQTESEGKARLTVPSVFFNECLAFLTSPEDSAVHGMESQVATNFHVRDTTLHSTDTSVLSEEAKVFKTTDSHNTAGSEKVI